MLAQITLTPTESKKLIAKAVARIEVVRQAAKAGMVLVHPCSSTYFIVEELTGSKPNTNHWVCGVVTPKGTCVEMGMFIGDLVPRTRDPGDGRAWWVIRDGKLSAGDRLTDLLEQMKPTDVFVKGVNALDPQGNTGVLVGNPVEAGTIGRVISSWRKKGFNLIFPVGLEKLIPISIAEASSEVKRTAYDYAMGMAVGLAPCPAGTTVTEVDAIRLLSGATAVPFSAGGLGGAEGAITMAIKGEDGAVKTAIEFVEQSKGAKLPPLRLFNCQDCSVRDCKFPVGDKHWAKP